MRALLFVLLLCGSVSAGAQVLDVTIFKPHPGKNALVVEHALEAKAIHEKLGAIVGTAFALDGGMHYALTFENWQAWAKFGEASQNSKEWQAFSAKLAKEPAAEADEHYLLDGVSPGGGGAVYQVYVWQAQPGRVGEMIQAGLKAEPIHEKAGVDVSVLIDQTNNMHYVMSFDSWEAWAKFRDGEPSEEWNAFIAEQNERANSQLTKVYTASEF